jgi:predicted nucleic acid-binding protein
MKIVFDSSSLILLVEKLNLRETLTKCASSGMTLIIPEKVLSEFKEKNDDPGTLTYINGTFRIEKNENCSDLSVFLDEDSGEISVASIGKELKECKEEYLCIIDEKYGSKIFKLIGIETKGTIGLLLFLKDRGILTSQDLKEIRDKIEKSDFRITKEYLDKLG